MNYYSIIIPILNEEKNIFLLTEKILEQNLIHKYEIIFVDDNSKDNTLYILQDLKKKYSNFNYIIRKEKNDLSKSICIGIKLASYENIIVMDGDLQHDPKYLKQLMLKFETLNIEILVLVRSFENYKGLSFYRTILSKILNKFISLTLGYKCSDPLSGYFCFKKNLYLRNKDKMTLSGYKFLFDLIYTSYSNKISELKINFKPRVNHNSKINLKVLKIFIQDYFKKIFQKLRI